MDLHREAHYDLISVIVPIYNVEKYLDKCIASIVGQTYQNLEIIMVEDGSTDRCSEICNKWAMKDTRIQVIRKTNGGLSDARNTGLSLATGEYIGFVDGDDYIHPEMYEKLWGIIKEYEADLAICGFDYVDENGNPMEAEGIELENGLIDKTVALSGIVDKRWNCVVWNKLYRKRLFHNIKFPYGMVYEDRMIMPWIVKNSSKIVVTTSALYYYVHSANSITRSKSIAKHLDLVEAYYCNLLFYKKYYPDLTQKIANQLVKQYLITRKLLKEKPAVDLERMKEINRMVCYCCLKYWKQIRLCYKLSFFCPVLYRTLIHMKRRLFRL